MIRVERDTALPPGKAEALDLQALQNAFDMALAEVLASPEGSIDEQQARDVIAKQIVAAAQESGERDPERLKVYALERFSP